MSDTEFAGGSEDHVAGGTTSSEQSDRGRDGRLTPGTSIGKPYRWVKGQSGNPGGRPKRADSILSQLAAELTEPRARRIAKRLLTMAETAEGPQALGAIRELLDRLDGTVAKRVEVTGEIRKTVILSRPEDGPRAGLTIDAKPVPVIETRTTADAGRDAIQAADGAQMGVELNRLVAAEVEEPKRPGVGFGPVPAPGLRFDVPTIEQLQRRAENGE